MPEQFFTVEEVADLLKVDPRTIRGAIHSGRLKAARVGRHGRHFRIAESDLKKYLDMGL
jgi:excisionase family DNA binding protein